MSSLPPQGPPSNWLRRRWAELYPWLLEGLIWARHYWIAVSVSVFLALVVGFLVARSLMPKPGERATGGQGGQGGQGGLGADAPATELTPRAPGEPPAAVPGAVARGVPGADAGAPLSVSVSPNVKVVFKTFPPRRASVMWGGKRLGFVDRGKPLVVERLRDSGPLDVVVRAPGYLPVYTRAYTFDDNTVEVRITPLDKKDTIYGYREPLPPDAGAPL
jgi:hypothetical protein